jgi:D-alanyl-D-alanine carboxypeptidase
MLAATCFGGAPSATVYQRLIDDAVAKGTPGLQVHVRRGTDRWSGVAGVCSVESGEAMTPTKPIRVASITKMMTCAAVIELVKQNRLSLTDRAMSHLAAGVLDGIPNAGEITVAHLLEHRSGLHNFNGEDGRDFFENLFNDPKRGARKWSPEELIAYARKPGHRPTGRPGDRVSYSSTGYIVLQMILERLEEKPLPEIYRQLLFEPLNMKATGVEGADFTTREIAASYARPSIADRARPSPFSGQTPVRPDGLVNLSAGLDYYNAWAQGAGAVASTADDLAKFMDAVTTGRIEVLTDQAAQFARSRQKQDGLFDWNGGSWGIQATILYQPSRDITVTVLLNDSNAGPTSHDLARGLLQAARQAD